MNFKNQFKNATVGDKVFYLSGLEFTEIINVDIHSDYAIVTKNRGNVTFSVNGCNLLTDKFPTLFTLENAKIIIEALKLDVEMPKEKRYFNIYKGYGFETKEEAERDIRSGYIKTIEVEI